MAWRPQQHPGGGIRYLTRLHSVLTITIVAIASTHSPAQTFPPGAKQNVIQTENAKPGTPDWEITNPATHSEIEGYASLTSVNRGDLVELFVNTQNPSYSLEIYRMGWYGGAGARRVLGPVQLVGIQQPEPKPDRQTGLIECLWGFPYELRIPDGSFVTPPNEDHDWVSGVHIARLTALPSRKQSYIIFVVRDDQRSSDILFQSSVTTFEAYNNWGGKSLYRYNSTGRRAYKVSFNRPYDIGSGSGSAGHFLGALHFEYNMVRFLERQGYDVTYSTDIDTHNRGDLLLRHNAFLSVGHDEYWSWQMRENAQKARDQGVNLGFFGANAVYWQIRLEPSLVTAAPDRTIVGYKQDALTLDPMYQNPATRYLTTTRWRDQPLNLPEAALVGTMFKFDPINSDMVVSKASSWVFGGTGLHNGSHLRGLLGYEIDSVDSSSPKGTQILAHSPYSASGKTYYSDMTLYQANSRALVVSTGTMQWNWGLDSYGAGQELIDAATRTATQTATANILKAFNAARTGK